MAELSGLEDTPGLREQLRPTRYAHLGARGAILYRAGRYREAVGLLHEAIEAHGKGGVFSDWVFLAMAQHRLGRPDEAAEWLTKANQDGSLPGTDFSWDGLERELLLREAQTLLGPPHGPISDERE